MLVGTAFSMSFPEVMLKCVFGGSQHRTWRSGVSVDAEGGCSCSSERDEQRLIQRREPPVQVPGKLHREGYIRPYFRRHRPLLDVILYAFLVGPSRADQPPGGKSRTDALFPAARLRDSHNRTRTCEPIKARPLDKVVCVASVGTGGHIRKAPREDPAIQRA